jgi:hypothetical protein
MSALRELEVLIVRAGIAIWRLSLRIESAIRPWYPKKSMQSCIQRRSGLETLVAGLPAGDQTPNQCHHDACALRRAEENRTKHRHLPLPIDLSAFEKVGGNRDPVLAGAESGSTPRPKREADPASVPGIIWQIGAAIPWNEDHYVANWS